MKTKTFTINSSPRHCSIDVCVRVRSTIYAHTPRSRKDETEKNTQKARSTAEEKRWTIKRAARAKMTKNEADEPDVQAKTGRTKREQKSLGS